MRLLLLHLILYAFSSAQAQRSVYTAYTVSDGLPSNNTYRCVEDNKGFLWVATDAGIARFDGKRFQVFTMKEGLPDNEVLSVAKDREGRIWVNCFKQSPAYFDVVRNRFINSQEDSALAGIRVGTLMMTMIPLPDGGMQFVNELGSFVYKDGQMTEFAPIGGRNLMIKVKGDSYITYGITNLKPGAGNFGIDIYQVRKGRMIDSVRVGNTKVLVSVPLVNNGNLYLFCFSDKKCFVYSNIHVNPLQVKIDSISVPEVCIFFEFSKSYLYALGSSGKMYLFNLKTLKMESILSGNYLANSMYDDAKGNIWVNTIDKGLLLYKKKVFDSYSMPANFTNTDFISITHTPTGLLAGNYYGEVVEVNGKSITVHSIPKKAQIARQRKVIVSNGKVFTFSEMGTYVNFKKELIQPSKRYYPSKTAIQYNDSLIIFGMYGLFKLNTKTEHVSFWRNGTKKRITALARGQDAVVYFGSTDGLYKFNPADLSVKESIRDHPLLTDRIVSICTTPDSLVWVATSGNGIAVLKADKVVLHISEKQGISNNAARTILSAKPGQVWLGTAGGISIIYYSKLPSSISYKVQNLSAIDGLSNNVVNEMTFKNDTVYAATAGGISVIPANVIIPHYKIPVELTRMRINQRDTVLATSYVLGAEQHNIQMEFAGVELYGHFGKLSYSLNGNASWIDLNSNALNLQLDHGIHTLQVRAVDVNGNPSDQILTIRFTIATPFWKALWFWVILGVMLQVITIFTVMYWQKRRRQAKLAREIASVQTAALKQQAFTSLMNPHFIFNALNSIQHYINVQDRHNANRYLSDFASLIRKSFEAAQRSFIPLEQELENIRIYLRLEQMRFADRFSYRINVDDGLEVDNWVIPTMMMQPLLENALLHGIMPSTIKGELTVDVKEISDDLYIIITDNGIGIKNSLSLNKQNGHKSHGMELIQKRISSLNCFGSQPIYMEMSPAASNELNPGNRIVLRIPSGLHSAWLKAQSV